MFLRDGDNSCSISERSIDMKIGHCDTRIHFHFCSIAQTLEECFELEKLLCVS